MFLGSTNGVGPKKHSGRRKKETVGREFRKGERKHRAQEVSSDETIYGGTPTIKKAIRTFAVERSSGGQGGGLDDLVEASQPHL